MKRKYAYIILAFLLVFAFLTPFAHAETFGNTHKNGTSTAWVGVDTVPQKTLNTLPEDGTIKKIYVYVQNNAGETRAIDVGVYDGVNRIVHVQTSIPVGYDDWLECDIADTHFTAGVYGLGSKCVGNNVNVYYDAGDANQMQYDLSGYLTGDPLPETFVVSGQLARNYCIYAEYTPDAAEPENISLTLGTPLNASTQTSYTLNMTYTPTLIGTDSFSNATLYVNGTAAATNQTAIANATLNGITYIYPGANATYLWDIQVYNSTSAVWSTNGNFTLTIAVPETGGDTTELEAEWLALGLLACTVTAATAILIVKKKRDG
jgi:hypothetical protein